MKGKIVLEEHIENPDFAATGEHPFVKDDYFDEVSKKLHDPAILIADMDRFGIETTIVSLTQPGIEGVPDAAEAVKLARQHNDYAHKTYVEPHRGRLLAFAAVPLQDPAAAADELERAVVQLGCVGALVNGYSNIGDEDTAPGGSGHPRGPADHEWAVRSAPDAENRARPLRRGAAVLDVAARQHLSANLSLGG